MIQLIQIHISYCLSIVLLVGQYPRVCNTIDRIQIFLNFVIILFLTSLGPFSYANTKAIL